MAVTCIVAYDVSSNESRARLAAWCGRHGVRRQKSVFECTVPEADLDVFVQRCESLVDVDRDVVEIFVECVHCHARRVSIGQVGVDLGANYWIVGYETVEVVPGLFDEPSGARPESQGATVVRVVERGSLDSPGDWRASGLRNRRSDGTDFG